jgi:glycosyltransferase involved in cell wall biosynthesis
LAKTVKRTRVAFFAEILIEDFDGAARTMFQLINRIDQTRFEYLFIYGVGPDQILDFESLKIPAIAIPVNINYKMALPVLAQTRLKKKLQSFAAEIVHIATPSLLGNFGLNYALQNRLPAITIYHTHFISYIDYYFKHTPFLISSIKQRMAENHRSFYNRCDKIYVPADSIKQELVEIGIDDDKMQIWKRGVDTSLFSPIKRDLSLMRRLTGTYNPTILFASRLVWEKNLEILFAVYDAMQAAENPVNFLVVGDGTARQSCQERMPKAIFTGSVTHDYLSVLYASSDVFLFPSVSETYGNVVLEAMASGLPCVIADAGGSKDFIEQGINGFKCKPYNAYDYAEKIELIIHSPLLRKQFAGKGLEESAKLSWPQLAQQYFDDVTNLANKSVLQLAAC